MDHFFTFVNIAKYGFLGHLSPFFIQHRPLFTELRKVTDTDNRMNPIHFGSNQAKKSINLDSNPGAPACTWRQPKFKQSSAIGIGRDLNSESSL